MSRICNI